MKKLILLLLVVFSVSLVFAQNQPEPQLSKEYYLQKSKRQKNLAWGLLGGGIASTIVATVIFKDNLSFSGETSSEENIGDALFYVGVGSSLASIPIFISADINSKKAAELAYEYRPMQSGPIYMNIRQEHAIMFRISLE